jgi:hypothetical protein
MKHSKVRVDKYLSDSFPIQNGLKQGDALSPLLLNFVSKFFISNVRGFFCLPNLTIVGFYYLFNCHMFRSYDHLQAEIYLLKLNL